MKTLSIFLFFAGQVFAAVGSWNGVAFTALNGIAQTSWNGTSISCASSGNPYGTEVATDNFTRANETPLAGNWNTVDADGPFNLSSNTAIPQNTSNDSAVVRNTGTFTNDQYSAVKFTGTGTNAGEGGGVCVRAAITGARTYYRLVVNSDGEMDLNRAVAGVFTSIATRAVTYGAGKVVALSISGTTLKIFYDGVQQGATVTDAIIATGNPGLAYSSTLTTPVFDDWSAGTVP